MLVDGCCRPATKEMGRLSSVYYLGPLPPKRRNGFLKGISRETDLALTEALYYAGLAFPTNFTISIEDMTRCPPFTKYLPET